MSYIHSLLNLYQPDERRGDILLTPQRYCNHVWINLATRPLNPHHHPIWQVAKRVAQLALLIIPTLIAYAVGLIAVTIKACSPHQVRHSHFPSFLQTVDPSFVPSNSTQQIDSHAVPTQQSFQLQPQKYLDLTKLPKDIALFSFTFLSASNRFNAMAVSKEFRILFRDPILWDEYLTNGDLRIWGARPNLFIRLANSYGFQQDRNRVETHSLDQIKAYYSLQKKGLSGPHNDFYDYLARLMPGGPIAFSRIPDLGPIDPDTLTPDTMSHSIVRGKTRDNRHFLALRIIDREKENGSPIVLLFKYSFKYSTPIVHLLIRQIDWKWEQPANEYWTRNQLNLTNQHVLNYILAIIKKDRLDDYQFPGCRPGVELV